MMDIRKIIREQMQIVFEDDAIVNSGLFGGALNNINSQLDADLDNVGKIINTQQIDIKNKDNEIKSNSQLQSKLDQTSPKKIGLTRELPEDKKQLDIKKKQLKDLQDAKKGITDAQKEIEKQQSDMQKKAKSNPNPNGSQTSSVLPSLQSPI